MVVFSAFVVSLLFLPISTIASPNFRLSGRAPACRKDICQKTLNSADPSAYASKLCKQVLNKPVKSTVVVTTIRDPTVTVSKTRTRTTRVTKTSTIATTEVKTATSTINEDADETSVITEKTTSTPITTTTLEPATEIITKTSTTEKDATETQDTTDIQSSTTTLTERLTRTKTSTRTVTDTVVKDELETRYSTLSITQSPTFSFTFSTTIYNEATTTLETVKTETTTQTATSTRPPSTSSTTSTVTITTTSSLPPAKVKRQNPTPYSSFTAQARSACGNARASLLSACSCYAYTIQSTTTAPISTTLIIQALSTSTVFAATTTDTSLSTTTKLTTSRNIKTLYTTTTDIETAPESTITESPTITRTTTKYVDSINLTTVYTTVISTTTIMTTETISETLSETQTDFETTSTTSTAYTTSVITETFVEPTSVTSTHSETRTTTVNTSTTRVTTSTELATTTVDGPVVTQTSTATTTVEAIPTGIIANNGFENLIISPWTQFSRSGGTTANVVDKSIAPPYRGNASLLLSSSGQVRVDWEISVTVPVTPNVQYALSVAYKLVYPSSCYARGLLRDATNSPSLLFARGQYGLTSPPANTWAIANSGLMGSPSGSQTLALVIYCSQIFSGPIAYFDEIILAPVSSVAYTIDSQPTSANLLSNPGFDTPGCSVPPWNGYQPILEQPGYNSQCAVRTTFIDNTILLVQTSLTVLPGAVYGFSFYYKRDQPSQSGEFLRIFMNGNDGYSSVYAFPTDLTGSDVPAIGSYGPSFRPFVALTSRVDMYVLGFTRGSKTFHFDNLKLVRLS